MERTITQTKQFMAEERLRLDVEYSVLHENGKIDKTFTFEEYVKKNDVFGAYNVFWIHQIHGNPIFF